MSPSTPSLKDHLLTSLSTLPNADKLHIISLTSTPKRTSSLFPHTTIPPRCFQVDYFVVLGCEVDVPLAPAPESGAGAEPQSATEGEGDVKMADQTEDQPSTTLPNPSTPQSQLVLTSAISAHLYILPQSQSSILYISKVDSSSYPSHTPTSRPLPLTRTLITSFISYFLLPASRPTPNVRVQLFARSQGQYLFPNSEAGKQNLGGAKLCGWWKGVYEDVARSVIGPSPSGDSTSSAPSAIASLPTAGPSQPKPPSLPEFTGLSMTHDKIPPGQLHLAYLLPSFSSMEALGVLGAPRQPLPQGVEWKYEPPFSTPIPGVGTNTHTGPSRVWEYEAGYSLADLIPSLEDDPKTRFLEEVANATGEEYVSGVAQVESDRKEQVEEAGTQDTEKASKEAEGLRVSPKTKRKRGSRGKNSKGTKGAGVDETAVGEAAVDEEEENEEEAAEQTAAKQKTALALNRSSIFTPIPTQANPTPSSSSSSALAADPSKPTSPLSTPTPNLQSPGVPSLSQSATQPLPSSSQSSSKLPKSQNPKSASQQQDEAYRQQAHRLLSQIKLSEFWERIGYRGECASNVTGFFTLQLSASPDWKDVLSSIPLPMISPLAPSPDPVNPSPSLSTSTSATHPDPVIRRGNLPHAIVERIQTALANTDFSTLEWALQGSEDWISSTRQIILGEIGKEGLDGWCEGVVPAKSAQELEALSGKGGKREREAEMVTVLQPRKKKKKI